MLGFSKKADMKEYSDDVRNILREEPECTADKFVRLTPHLDHLTKLGRKVKSMRYLLFSVQCIQLQRSI
jgi:hypothetical protein